MANSIPHTLSHHSIYSSKPVTLFHSALFIFIIFVFIILTTMKIILVYLYFLLISSNKIKCECEDRVCWSCFIVLPTVIRWTKHTEDVHTLHEMNKVCFKNTSLFSNLICFSKQGTVYYSSSKSPDVKGTAFHVALKAWDHWCVIINLVHPLKHWAIFYI